jgi:type IV pilus assembly protein PilB
MLACDDFVFASLVESGVLSPANAAHAQRAALESHARPSEAALSLGLVDSRTVAIARAETSEYPFVRIADFKLNFQNAALLPRSAAESLHAFPLFVCQGVVTVGMEDPLDFRAVDQLRALLRSDIAPVVCDRDELRGLIERAYGITLGARETGSKGNAAGVDLAAGDEPIVVAVNSILAQGVDMGASDVHIGPDEHELQLRFRVDGVLRRVAGPALSAHAGIVQRLKVMADLDVTESRRPQDGRFRFSVRGRDVDVRASLIPTVHGENVVLRLLSSAASIRGFEELGFPATELRRLRQIIHQPHGMILVTGPTGSGKTTTLYTGLKELNSPDVNIMTIEDPVEIPMPMMRQVQVNAQIGMTFAGALRSILRQDPDVVFVGEIRDAETARISVQAALTGHLVLSSLHTNDAAGAVPRLHDLDVPAFAINAALTAVIAQRLARRVCEDCARQSTPPRELLARFDAFADESRFRSGAGCARCAGEGYRGRVGLFEMMSMSDRVRRAIERQAGIATIAAAAHDDGMREMWRDGLEKAVLGLTTLEEVARVVSLGDVEHATAPVREAA